MLYKWVYTRGPTRALQLSPALMSGAVTLDLNLAYTHERRFYGLPSGVEITWKAITYFTLGVSTVQGQFRPF